MPVPNRSTGNPINKWYRQPTPGSRPEALTYIEPVTIPAGDIAENPYWKRDHRRNYPQTAFYDQATIAGLLTYGSAANPRIAKGEAGTKALTQIQEGQISLNQTLAAPSAKDVILGEVLDKTGNPPIPPSLTKKNWQINPETVSGMYSEHYPVRSFS